MSQNPYETPLQWSAQTGPGANPTHVLKEISAQATASLVVGIISIVCFGTIGLVLAPFAIYRGSKALRLIREHDVGHQHSGTAYAGRVIGIVSLVLNVIGALGLMVLLCSGIAANA